MKKYVYGSLILCLVMALLGCGGGDTGSGGGGSGGQTTTAAGGEGGSGGVTDTGGSMTTTSSSSSSSTDPGLVVGAPETCSGNTSIAPGTGQAGFHEEGAFACRRFVPPPGHPHLRSWAPAVGLGPSCVAFPIAASFLAPIEQTSFDATDPAIGYTETPIDDSNTEPVITVDADIPEGQAFFACLRLLVDEAGGVSCTTGSTCEDAEDPALADMLFSEVKPDKTIDAWPTIKLVELRYAPDPDWAVTLGNDRRAWNTTATFD